MIDRDQPRPEPFEEVAQLRARIADLESQLARSQQAETVQRSLGNPPAHANGLTHDSLGQEWAEAVLRESEKSHRALVAGLPDIVARFDRDGRHLFQSDNIRVLGAHQAAQCLGKTHRELGFPESQCRVWEEAIRSVFDSGVPVEAELTFAGERGPTVHDWRLVPERDAQGKIQSVLSLLRDVTAQRQLEQDYRTLFREMLDGLALHEIICDERGQPVDYRFLDVNPAFERMTGLSAKDIVGRTVLDVLPGTERHWIETYGQVALSGEPAFFEDYSGELQKYFEVRAFRSAPRQFVCIVADITDRKRAEEKLRKNEEKFHKAFHSSPAAMSLSTAQEGRFLDVNAEYLKMIERDREEVLGHTSLELGVWADPEQRATMVAQLRLQGTVRSAELEIRTKSGSIRHILWSAEEVFIDGQSCLLGTALDITERKQAEAARRDAETRYRLLFERSPDGIVIVDPATARILEFNETAHRQLGYSREEFAGLSIADIEALESPEDIQARIARVMHEGRNEFDTRQRTRHGDIRHVHVTAQFTEMLGRPVYHCVWRDITRRKQAEEELRAAIVELQQAAARSAELAERAEAANRAKSEFLANMSHEIRTPMTAILGHTEMLSTEELSPSEQAESLRTIQRSGEALLGIINDILDLSRIEADRLPLYKTDCALQQILDEVMAVAKITAAKKGLRLQVTYRLPMPVTIHTDPARLRQILVNLVGNAVKFTERGDVGLSVCCSRSREGTAQIQFVVSDTGMGIPADKLQEIFQPFQQVDGSHTRRFGGVGLGLSICQRLAQALAGRIEVVSELGRGSTFTLTVEGGPWRESPGRMASDSPTVGASTNSVPTPVLQGRVLLVEDDPSVQVVIRHLLRKLNLEVEVAADGQLACQLAAQSRSDGRPYALILMDVQLPQLDGLAATRWLRTQGWSGPIVALTAYAMVGDRERCLAAGCDDYLSKPISPSLLREVVQQHLT